MKKITFKKTKPKKVSNKKINAFVNELHDKKKLKAQTEKWKKEEEGWQGVFSGWE